MAHGTGVWPHSHALSHAISPKPIRDSALSATHTHTTTASSATEGSSARQRRALGQWECV
jgi:hypothetical protein